MKAIIKAVLISGLLMAAIPSAFAQRPRQPLSDEAQQQVESALPAKAPAAVQDATQAADLRRQCRLWRTRLHPVCQLRLHAYGRKDRGVYDGRVARSRRVRTRQSPAVRCRLPEQHRRQFVHRSSAAAEPAGICAQRRRTVGDPRNHRGVHRFRKRGRGDLAGIRPDARRARCGAPGAGRTRRRSSSIRPTIRSTAPSAAKASSMSVSSFGCTAPIHATA